MLLDFGGTKIRFQIREEASLLSRHSGRDLQRLSVQTTLRNRDDSEHFLTLLNAAKNTGLTSVDESGNTLSSWKVNNSSWSYNNNSPLHHHTLEIEEIELLEVSSLEIMQMDIKPYFYNEYFDNDCLYIRAKALLTEEQHIFIKNLLRDKTEVPVIRHGISETPCSMVLLPGYWSKDGKQIKHEIVLRDDQQNEQTNFLAPMRFALGAVPNQVAESQAVIDALLEILVSKSILSGEEVTQIRNAAADNIWENRYLFFEVNDIDEK